MLMNLVPNIIHINGVYGKNHARAVCASKININISTSGGASDRVFKVLAAGGFLLTTDWEGREELFEDNKHLSIFSDKEDLQKKITYYLNNEDKRYTIAKAGLTEISKYNRDAWASRIVELFNEVTSEQ
jgi:spore maturation protein CgeB